MPKRTIKFNLDFSKKDILSKFEIKQFDNAIIEISPFLDNLSYTVSESTNIKLYVCISNDVFKQESNITIQENKIIIDLDKNIIAKKGKALAELELSDNTGVTTSTTFIFDVEGKVGEGSVVAGGTEGLIAKYQRLLKEFKQEQQLQLDDINKTLESHAEQLNSNKSQLAQIESKNIEQDTRLKQVARVNKTQQVYINGLFNENKDGRLSVEGEGNSLKLEGSKEGLVTVDKVVGNTFVNIMSSDDEIYNNDRNDINTDKWQLINVKAGSSISNHIFTLIGKDTNILFRRKLDTMPLKPSTRYTLIVETLETGYTGVVCTLGNKDKFVGQTLRNLFNTVGITKTLITTLDDFSSAQQDMYIYFSSVSAMDSVLKFKMYILEGDFTNKPIPSEVFEGLQSSFESNLVTQEMVTQGLESEENLGKYKVHVKVVGKNLFDINKYPLVTGWVSRTTGTVSASSEWERTQDFIPIEGNTIYTLITETPTGSNPGYALYDGDYKFISGDKNGTFLTSADTKFIKFTVNAGQTAMLCKGTYDLSTDYEDYFERTTNVYLNSPLLEGDEIVMKDGELCHYHKCDGGVLNGSDDEGWVRGKIMGTYTGYYITPNVIRDCMVISDKVAQKTYSYYVASLDAEYIATGDSRIVITSTASDLETFKQSIKTNPIKVVYELAEPWYEPIQVDKLLLECANDSTLHIDTVVPVETVKASYTGNVPSVYALEETNQTQDSLIDISLCATDEMYTMIEPLLSAVPQTLNNERMISKMVDMYVAMVIRGLKTIDEVPVRYRKEVQNILDKLEK